VFQQYLVAFNSNLQIPLFALLCVVSADIKTPALPLGQIGHLQF